MDCSLIIVFFLNFGDLLHSPYAFKSVCVCVCACVCAGGGSLLQVFELLPFEFLKFRKCHF